MLLGIPSVGRGLSRYRSTNLRRSVWDQWSTGRIWEGESDARKAMEPMEVLPVMFVSLVNKIVLFGTERGACVEENGPVWRLKEDRRIGERELRCCFIYTPCFFYRLF